MQPKEERVKRIIPNDKNLSLKEYFANLPKAERRPVIISAPKEELVEKISHLCGKTKMTARRWVYGYVEPSLAEKEKIATLIGCPVEVLFPEKK
ncbi:MAG: XRE family transcriptional regulator [Tannerellaceae bacterium]|nr:XRE family transcriptional regulator [Tannerellaceae bacterium]